ncbi:sorting nexin-20 [Protopterus annectens]|uniref:sorting nexin-20 n=1 Tax=Protopterus annectens TaxID=7888 RepID=UPI001CF9D558|nr:sorting nexin-20 [Protopterus annectens]
MEGKQKEAECPADVNKGVSELCLGIQCRRENEEAATASLAAEEEGMKNSISVPDNCNSPTSSSSMTTRELQEYWRNVKCSKKPVKLLFEIPSARIVEDPDVKYVKYKVVVIKSGSYDGIKSCVERRYSDFERLHKGLLKDFKEEMEDVIFPRKRVIGNFSVEMINGRRAAFMDYLEILHSIKYIRRSNKFIDFFIVPELEEAYNCLRGGSYTEALEILLEVLVLQEKLTQHNPMLLAPTLCAIVVCYKDLGDLNSAYEYSERALLHLHGRRGYKYYIPLLDTMITLAYDLGKDITPLREKEADRPEKAVPTLKELVVQEHVDSL